MSDIRQFLIVAGGIKKKLDTLWNFFIFIFYQDFKRFYLYDFIILFQSLLAGSISKKLFLSIDQESLIKSTLLKKDNKVREILSLQESSNNAITADSRKAGSWWRQIILNKGSKDGVEIGNTVIGPGGLLGRVNDTTIFTSSVTLLTSPESKLGVWVDRIQINGLLVGTGIDTPSLILYTKDADLKVGDYVSSSPASTLLPPNIPIGVVQSVNDQFQSKKTAKILLLAKPQVIDWVQILK